MLLIPLQDWRKEECCGSLRFCLLSLLYAYIGWESEVESQISLWSTLYKLVSLDSSFFLFCEGIGQPARVFDLLPVTKPVQKVISTLVMKFRVFMCRFLNDKGVRCLFAKPQGGSLYFTLIKNSCNKQKVPSCLQGCQKNR